MNNNKPVRKRLFEEVHINDEDLPPLKIRKFNHNITTKSDETVRTNTNLEDDQLGCNKCKKQIAEGDAAICEECEKIFCKECSYDMGMCCANCKQFMCYHDWDGSVCVSCNGLYCAECGDFKPGKGGDDECYDCQPWWKKDRPAEDFCVECGSGRSNAEFCVGCGKRYCFECQLNGCYFCAYCGSIECEYCRDNGLLEWCDVCEIMYCDDCEDHHYDQCG